MSECKFTKDHEWIRMEGDEIGVVGITDYAQDQLGELVFVNLPEVGTEYAAGAETAVVESVKAAGEVKAPVTGVVVEVNASLAEEPEKVNNDPMGEGWFLKIRVSDAAELDGLMDENAYQAYVADL
ncbi:MAG: glycine cleavage system protein GcvH [Ectothiorhodospiraceae bacterium]|nr:glycine cleavage system protein GcvH [Chromatiales bacterium]MCP5156704.1 glycine cleavage system protein GcvH [Ectothiorhodospiraceae bacterium]